MGELAEPWVVLFGVDHLVNIVVVLRLWWKGYCWKNTAWENMIKPDPAEGKIDSLSTLMIRAWAD